MSIEEENNSFDFDLTDFIIYQDEENFELEDNEFPFDQDADE